MNTLMCGKRRVGTMGAMNHDELLSGLESTGGMALLSRGEVAPWLSHELHEAWRAAHEEAVAAYSAWLSSRDRDAYTVYRAAEDRADAAQEALALSASRGGAGPSLPPNDPYTRSSRRRPAETNDAPVGAR
jgi:hypothetical protein